MDWLTNWFFELLYILQKSICYIIDFICEIFYKLAGIEPVNISGKQTDILSHFVMSEGVKTAFLGVFLIGVVLLCIFVIIAIIRSEAVDGQGKRTKGQILTKAGHSFIIFLIIPFVLIAGILLANTVMGAIDSAMTVSVRGGDKSLLGGQILVTSGHGAYKWAEAERAAIEQAFINGTLDYNNITIVKKYYNLSDINFFVGILSSFIIMLMFALAVLKFVQRLFDIILLYIISPVSVSTIPLDDGQRFKIWREMLISKVLGAYGIILSMNLFFLIVPQISAINFFDDSFKNGIVSLLVIIGGAFAVVKANMVISQLTGSSAGAQEAQQMLSGITAGVRMVRGAGRGIGAVVGRMIGGSDFMNNRKRGAGFSDNVSASINSTRNQRVVNAIGGADKVGDKEKRTKAQATGRVAAGALRLATLPVGVLKDIVQGGVITTGKNIVPRLKNVIKGKGVINRADVVRKHAEAAAEKSTESVIEKGDIKTGGKKS